jgi:hypothetical protein
VVSVRLLALNIYTDASPVMGVEIQGLVVDLIFKDRAMERVVMPGGTLSYGRCGAMNKTAALLYSLWLLFGPDEEMLRRVLLLVRTITTDFGVEMGTVDSPDFLKAWFARLGGAAPDICRSMVDCHTRLFPMCLRISGWSHAWGNLMKSIAKSCQQWPRILDASRSLCRFFRPEGWRTHIKLCLAGSSIDLTPLDRFTAGFAKWRYETIAVVFEALAGYSDIAQNGVRSEFFQNFQDISLFVGCP